MSSYSLLLFVSSFFWSPSARDAGTSVGQKKVEGSANLWKTKNRYQLSSPYL